MRIKTRLEQIESASARVERGDPTRERLYQATLQLLCDWNGDTDALLAELRRRNRRKPKPEPLDLSDMFDQSAEFVRSVNRVAERLRFAPLAQEWKAVDGQEPKPRHIKLVK